MEDNIIETINKLSERLNAISEHRPKILIIDDDKSYSDLLSIWFHQLGFYTELALTGESGLSKLMTNTFDAIWLDLKFSGMSMSGDEILKNIHIQKPNHAVIIASGVLKQGDEEKYKKLGAIEVFEKPHNAEELKKLIERLKHKVKK